MNQKGYSTFQNSAFPSINNIGQKKNTIKRPCTCMGRDEKIDKDLYYSVKEENEELKRVKLSLNEKIKKLETSLASIRENLIKERRKADYHVVSMDPNFDINFEKLRYEKEKLKFENDKKDLYIQGLKSTSLINKTKKTSKMKKKGKSKDNLTNQMVKNDYLALIARLREQLKNANEDRRNLISELQNIKDIQKNFMPNMHMNYSDNNNYLRNSNPNREMTNKLADLNSHYESVTLKLDSQNQILDMTKKTLEEFKEKYELERNNNIKLQSELSLLKGDADKMLVYKKQLEESKANERKLEQEISELRLSPFIKQAEERGNVYRSYQISEKNLAEVKKSLKEKEKLLDEAELRVKELEDENKELKDSLSIAKIQKDKYKDEALKFKITQLERENNDKLFQDKINQFSQFGELESNLVKTLSHYKTQNDKLNWGNINFIEPNVQKINDPNVLKNEINRLKIEKNNLGNELESTKNFLIIQQQLSNESKSLKDSEIQKCKSEIKLLKQKIEELCALIDTKNLPKDNTFLRESDIKYTKSVLTEDKRPKKTDDKISEFSQDDTDIELGINENALDIYFGECLYEDGLSDEIGFDIGELLSFFSVDFYMHETQTSDIINGKNPMFNFQVIFKVEINENLLNYLENDFVNVEFYSIRDKVQLIFGEGKISLKELLTNENSFSNEINSVCQIYHNKNKELKIGTIFYKMRMRKPIKEALRWYHELNKISSKNEIGKETMLSKTNLELQKYSNLGENKPYEIKILITKAMDLVVSGPARRISPYFYYKFFKSGERYSKICAGNNPEFEDTATFTEIFSKEFLSYLEKDTLNVYIFDGMNPIEIDVNENDEAKFVDNEDQESQDLIGICRIELQELLIHNLIQGEFPVLNLKNQRVGKLVINIFLEEMKF